MLDSYGEARYSCLMMNANDIASVRVRALEVQEQALAMCKARVTLAATWNAIESEWEIVRAALEAFARRSALNADDTDTLRTGRTSIWAYRNRAWKK